jgi:hypothetical protein
LSAIDFGDLGPHSLHQLRRRPEVAWYYPIHSDRNKFHGAGEAR